MATNPTMDIVSEGLHRLAQPITVSLWLVEDAESRAASPAELARLGDELRRAIDVLRMLREAMATDAGDGVTLDGAAWLKAQQNGWSQLCAARDVCLRVRISGMSEPRLDPSRLSDSAAQLIEQMLTLAADGDTLVAELSGRALSFTLLMNAAPQIAVRKQFAACFSPFEAAGFDYTVPTPPALLLRSRLAAMGIGLSVAFGEDSVKVSFSLPVGDQDHEIASKSA